MQIKKNPETGHFQMTGSIAEDGTKIAGIRQLYGVFSGPKGEKLMSEIRQDAINRGYRAPLVFKVLSGVKDKETKEQETALNVVEQLRKKRLWLEKATGKISEAEYQTHLREGQ
jgi:hypothetical protein